MLTWLHIGDLHACRDDDYRSVEDLHRIVAQVQASMADGLDFIYLPGDNANNGLPEQYQRINQALAGLDLPVHAIPGDHDFEPGHLDAFLEMRGAVPGPYAMERKGHPLLFLDAVSAGGGGPDFRLGEAQRRWLRQQLLQASSGGPAARPVVFMHGYPADFRHDHAFLVEQLHAARVAMVDTGHTHYNELLNDGRVLYSATRSTGQIEEDQGRPGFSIVALDGPHVSWRFRRLDAQDPFVLITSPTDHRLVTDPAQQIPGATIALRAKVFGTAIGPVRAWLESGETIELQPAADEPCTWQGTLTAPEEPIYRIHVEATDAQGRRGGDLLTVVGADHLARLAPQVQAPAGSDAHVTRPWPEHGYLGTQLGPNKFGAKW